MYAFECSLHALPDREILASGATLTDSCGQWPTLLIAQDQLITPLPIVFDDVLNQLNTLPRLYAEPDGSFVWTSPQENIRWQVNGNLYERNDRVLFVEIKGSCDIIANPHTRNGLRDAELGGLLLIDVLMATKAIPLIVIEFSLFSRPKHLFMALQMSPGHWETAFHFLSGVLHHHCHG